MARLAQATSTLRGVYNARCCAAIRAASTRCSASPRLQLDDGQADEASRRYVKVLELDPRNALAQAGLIGMLGRADPQSAETRVKQLIAREPSSAYLFFALGITYVDQKRWPDAQQAFFQAGAAV